MAKLSLVSGDPSESIIKEQILTYLWYNKVFCWINSSTGIYDPKFQGFRKMNSKFQMKGVSDILGIFKGRPLAIEVKSKRGVVSEHQAGFLRRFAEMGGISLVCRSVEDVESNLFRYYAY